MAAPHRYDVELLENRHLLSSTPIEPPDSTEVRGAIDTVLWQGRGMEAWRDRYVVKMPQTNLASSRGFWDYASDAPQVREGWSRQELGGGYYTVTAPGVSQQDVSTWAAEQAVLSIAPDQVLERQAFEDENKLPTRVPNDEFYKPYQWGLNNLGGPAVEGTAFPRRIDADIDAPQAWAYLPNGATGSKSVIVAVLDDGIDHSHPDIQPNMWQRPNVTNAAGEHISDVTGFFGFNSAEWLAASAADKPKYFDNRAFGELQYLTQPGTPYGLAVGLGANDSHGTHVAGIIGAKSNNTRGVAGVNWDVSMYSANIFRFGQYDTSGQWVGRGGAGAVSAFVDAVNRIIRLKQEFNQPFVVANCSFNTYNNHPAMLDAVTRLAGANILLVAAAGNGYDPCETDGVGDNLDAIGCPDGPVYPASYRPALDNVIAVGASTAQDKLARFSNWGTTTVDIAAPGENIWSTVPISARRFNPGTTETIHYDSREPFESPPTPGVYAPIVRPLPYRTIPEAIIESPPSAMASEGGYASMSGTSMSAAFVSGAAALLAADYLEFTRVLPSLTLLRNAILNGADRLNGLEGKALLNYVESAPGVPATDEMYDVANDPNPGREHRIAQDRRLNLYGSIDWLRKNMPPNVFFVVNKAKSLEGDVGTTAVTFTAKLSKPASSALTVYAWTEVDPRAPHPATPGEDYENLPRLNPLQANRSFTIPAGVKEYSVPAAALPVRIFGDATSESDETFVVRFAMDPTSVAWLSSSATNVTIGNDDGNARTPVVRLASGRMTALEGNGGTRQPTIVHVPVELSQSVSNTVFVNYRVTSDEAPTPRAAAKSQFVTDAGGVESPDFIAQTGRFRIPAFQTEAVIPVRIFGDRRPEESEHFFVELISANTNTGVLKTDSSQALIVIEDDDATPASMPIASIAGPGGPVAEGSNAVFTVSLSAPVPAGWIVTVFYATKDGTGEDRAKGGSDYSAARMGRVVINEGESTKSITVQTLADRRVEATEVFSVRLTGGTYRDGASGQSGTLTFGSPTEVTAAISDGPGLAAARLFAATAGAAGSRPLQARGLSRGFRS